MSSPADFERQSYCDGLDRQLAVFEGQLKSLLEKSGAGTEAEKTAVQEIAGSFPEAALRARRHLWALRQDGEQYRLEKEHLAASWDEMRRVVEDAKAVTGD
jgi:hypothetical protein